MKTISAVIPIYNEKENIMDGYKRVEKIFKESLTEYNYEILFIDNYSTDGTRDMLRILAKQDRHVKVILNARNFGWSKSSYYGITQITGDCAVLLAADMQEPPEKMVDFVREWEKGYRLVIGIKSKSKENKFKYFLRKCYYHLLHKISEIQHINQFMGFGLYDKKFVEVLADLDDPLPYLRGIVAELGFERKEIEYTQEARKKGKTHFNFFKMYDLAMLGITSYSKAVMRIATFFGFFTGVVSLLIALITLIVKLVNWDAYPVGIAAIAVGVFIFGSLQLFFIGFLGEYVLNINTRIMHRPLVIEEERLNFCEEG